VNEQIQLDHNISIICINNTINEGLRNSIDKRVRFIEIGRPRHSRNPYYMLKFNRILFGFKADIYHFHSPTMYRFILPFFKKIYKKRQCVVVHDVLNDFEQKYLFKYKNVFAISKSVKDNILQRTGIESKLVCNGINKSNILKKDNYFQGGVYKIVQISRLYHIKKGQHILIEAIKRVKDRGYKVSVDFIGEGPSFDYLSELIKSLELENEVKLLGAKSQQYIFEHLCKYDLFVQPSIFEGFGLTVAEAMAAKVPVLVSENQGPLEIIDNGKYGYSFKNEDAEDCANKIIEIIEQGVDNKMIEAAYKRVEELYSVQQTAINYINAYRAILESNKHKTI
ncbi:MAG: glycosyltransferase family 4 protein, partial [Clostridia bacterium]|nr:glycosyltransferase family 4 protein [Clostridia bacterium]